MAQAKSSSALLFTYVLRGYREVEFNRLLRKCGAEFNSDFLIWVLTFFDPLLEEDDPDQFVETIYAINPFTKQIFQLQEEFQEPTLGQPVDDEEVSARILLNMMEFVQVAKVFEEMAIQQTASDVLFELILGVINSNSLSEILLADGEGAINGDYFIWTSDSEKARYYAINPKKKVIYDLGYMSQTPSSGVLVTDKVEILELVEDILAYIEDNKHNQFIVLYKFNPAQFVAGKTFSLN
jgi:hypothetical protein